MEVDVIYGCDLRRCLTRQAVSLRLRVLKEAGLVDVHNVGQRRVYRLSPHGVEP